MRLPTSFAPIEPGEVDNLAFDFGPDAGAATMMSTSWTCLLAPGQNPLVDANPQSRIISAGVETTLIVSDALTGEPLSKIGVYSVALVGNMPMTADGANYIVEATANMSDGRVLKLNAILPCSSTQIQ